MDTRSTNQNCWSHISSKISLYTYKYQQNPYFLWIHIIWYWFRRSVTYSR